MLDSAPGDNLFPELTSQAEAAHVEAGVWREILGGATEGHDARHGRMHVHMHGVNKLGQGGDLNSAPFVPAHCNLTREWALGIASVS